MQGPNHNNNDDDDSFNVINDNNNDDSRSDRDRRRPLPTTTTAIIEELENAAAAVAAGQRQPGTHDHLLQRPFEAVEVPPEHLQPNVSAVTFKSNSLFVPTLYPSNYSEVLQQMDNAIATPAPGPIAAIPNKGETLPANACQEGEKKEIGTLHQEPPTRLPILDENQKMSSGGKVGNKVDPNDGRSQSSHHAGGKAMPRDGDDQDMIHPSNSPARPLHTIIEDLENTAAAAAAVAAQRDDRLVRPFDTVEVPPQHLRANVSAVTFQSNSLFVPTLYPSTNSGSEALEEQMNAATTASSTTTIPKKEGKDKISAEEEEEEEEDTTLPKSNSVVDVSGKKSQNDCTSDKTNEKVSIKIMTDSAADASSSSSSSSSSQQLNDVDDKQGNMEKHGLVLPSVGFTETARLQTKTMSAVTLETRNLLYRTSEINETNKLDICRATIVTNQPQDEGENTGNIEHNQPPNIINNNDNNNNDNPTLPTGTEDIPPRVLPPRALSRGRNVRPQTQPGAVAVSNAIGSSHQISFSGEDGSSSGVPGDAGNNHPEILLTATLVNSLPRADLVQAEPAHEGFAALVRNRYFKPAACTVTFTIILAISIPLAIVPQVSNSTANPSVIPFQQRTCGSRHVHQSDYRGNISVAADLGMECQRWDSQFPHMHNYTSTDIEENDMANNYCRNPCGDCALRAWCYTMDPQVKWAYCDVPFCLSDFDYENVSTECGHAGNGWKDYRGTISVSAAGNTCKRWDELEPKIRAEFPPGVLDENYCRNHDDTYPFCYTTDENREYCDIPQCEALSPPGVEFKGYCENCTKEECGTLRLGQSDYRGPINTSISGLPCVNWTIDSPFEVEQYGLQENQCRGKPGSNPEDFAWCVTERDGWKEKWEVCDIPACVDDMIPRRYCGSRSLNQGDYRGGVRHSEKGKECSYWIGDDAVLLRKTPFSLPWDGLVANYCRNPENGKTSGSDGRTRHWAWCYVDHEEGEQSWEYCDIDDCQDCGTKSLNYKDYTGTQSKTRSGQECIPWEGMEHFLVEEDSSIAQDIRMSDVTMVYTNAMRMDLQLEANFCRNPLNRETTFCFIDESGAWEYCDVDTCKEDTSAICGSQAVAQSDYRGPLNVSVSNRPCIPWANQDEYPPHLYPASGLDGAECRQPAHSGRFGAWCFVNETDSTWEYCAVPVCPVSYDDD